MYLYIFTPRFWITANPWRWLSCALCRELRAVLPAFHSHLVTAFLSTETYLMQINLEANIIPHEARCLGLQTCHCLVNLGKLSKAGGGQNPVLLFDRLLAFFSISAFYCNPPDLPGSLS